MAKKVSDILLISDLDGTLVTADHIIPTKNIEAINRFIQNGGNFAIATGRTLKSALDFTKSIPINKPGILLNGSIIYDFAEKKILWQAFLPPEAKELCREIINKFSYVAVEFMCQDDIYIIHKNEQAKRQSIANDYFINIDSIEAVPNKINKIVLATEPDNMKVLKEFIAEKAFPGIKGMRSCAHLYELLPKDANKGTALKKIADIFSIPINNIYAIGDYDNDADMLTVAGFSATPCEASQQAKLCADIELGSCEQGAVAEFIEYIEKSL